MTSVGTKIGIITEGVIDVILLGPLLASIAQEKAAFDWPLEQDRITERFRIRKRGYGGVVEAVRQLVTVLQQQYFEHIFFVILLDERTEVAQKEIRRLIGGRQHRFVLGVAIREIEAWWLADRTNTLDWAGLAKHLPTDTRYAAPGYTAERDNAPKSTLDELTRRSSRFDRFYGVGNVDLATDFANNYWRSGARLDDIAAQCPRGFGPFERKVTNAFRRAKAAAGRLF